MTEVTIDGHLADIRNRTRLIERLERVFHKPTDGQ